MFNRRLLFMIDKKVGVNKAGHAPFYRHTWLRSSKPDYHEKVLLGYLNFNALPGNLIHSAGVALILTILSCLNKSENLAT